MTIHTRGTFTILCFELTLLRNPSLPTGGRRSTDPRPIATGNRLLCSEVPGVFRKVDVTGNETLKTGEKMLSCKNFVSVVNTFQWTVLLVSHNHFYCPSSICLTFCRQRSQMGPTVKTLLPDIPTIDLYDLPLQGTGEEGWGSVIPLKNLRPNE